MGWKWLAAEDGGGVGDADEVGVGLAVALGDDGVGFAHTRGAAAHAVGVGGKEVHPAVFEEAVGELFGLFAPFPEHRIGSDLHQKAAAHPSEHAAVICLKCLIPFGMGEDWRLLRELEFVVGFGEAVGKSEVGELDEKVAEAVDGVTDGIFQRGLDVVVGEVEVAAEAEGQRNVFGGDLFAKDSEFLLIYIGIELILAVRMRGADDVGDAFVGSHAGHGDGGFEVAGTVVEAEQQVVMDVDHAKQGITGGFRVCSLQE